MMILDLICSYFCNLDKSHSISCCLKSNFSEDLDIAQFLNSRSLSKISFPLYRLIFSANRCYSVHLPSSFSSFRVNLIHIFQHDQVFLDPFICMNTWFRSSALASLSLKKLQISLTSVMIPLPSEASFLL